MSDFFRFPHTPHLCWLGQGSPRDDKVMSSNEVAIMLLGFVLLEEKLDGANLGLCLAPDGRLRVQNRGQYLNYPYSGQFSKLGHWLDSHEPLLRAHVDSSLIVFGEWCAARHSIGYEKLPDWYLMFDVYDRKACKFWSTSRRNKLADKLGLKVVPQISKGKFTLNSIKNFVLKTKSEYSNELMEGVVIRNDSELWCESRAKLVRPDFTQSIEEHWRNRMIEWNDRVFES